ncbi:PQQ-dependent sugar dehydrogenase [Arenicella xantha]|nr:PQQ-dependent sugar dehydrogenase [Arenicella xantha]
MGSFLERWNARYAQFTDIGESQAACQICHVSPAGGSTNGWNSYGWEVFELLESRRPFDVSDLDYAFDFAGLENSDQNQSGSSNITEVQAGYFPGWSEGSVNSHYFGSPSGSHSVVNNQLPPANLSVALLDPPAKILNPSVPLTLSGDAIELAAESRQSGLSWPRGLVVEASQPNVIFIVDLNGLITRFDTSNNQASVFIDLGLELAERLLVETDLSQGVSEHGLLNMVFAPDYATSKKFYTFHTEPLSAVPVDFTTLPNGVDAHHNNVVTEWTVLAQSDLAVTSFSSRTLLRIAQPQAGNNGGAMHFDSTGALLIGFGDGGAEGDQDQTIEFNGSIFQTVRGHGEGNASDLSNPLGSVLRIDPQGHTAANGQYSIPFDNPFVGVSGLVEEVFAYGFRSPSQISQDPSGALFVVDLGEVAIDEINWLSAAQFYGWNQAEGTYSYNFNGFLDDSYLSNRDAQASDEPPVLAIDRSLGQGVVLEALSKDNTTLAGQDFDWLVGVRDSIDSQNNLKLLGVDFNGDLDEYLLTPIELKLGSSSIEIMHSIKVLANGRVFISANTDRASDSMSGVIYELVERDQSMCFIIKVAHTGVISPICL